MTRLGYIKRTPLRPKKKEPRAERIPLAIPRPNEVKKEIEVEHTFRDGRTKINQLCKEGRAHAQVAAQAHGEEFIHKNISAKCCYENALQSIHSAIQSVTMAQTHAYSDGKSRG